MSAYLIALRAAEDSASARLKMLQDVRHATARAMEAAHLDVISHSALSDADHNALDYSGFHHHLREALDSHFCILIDAADQALYDARQAVEQAEWDAEDARETRIAELRAQGHPADVARELAEATE